MSEYIADAALMSLDSHEGSLTAAVERIEHIDGTKAQWRKAVAILALESWTYRRASGEAARLALSQITSIVDQHRETTS